MNLTDTASVASLVSLVGLAPVAYNAGLQLRDRRRRQRSQILRDSQFPNWQIVRPSYQGNMARVEDVAASQIVAAKLTSLGLGSRIIDHREHLEASANVVLICGPRGNEKSLELSQRLTLPIAFDTTQTPAALVDSSQDQTYRSPSDGGKSADVALFGRVTLLDQRFYILWGLHGVGTIGAAKVFADDQILGEAARQAHGRDFVGVLYVPFTSLDNVGTPRWLAPPVAL